MLKRRSIRTKLLLALGMLSAIVGLLAISGFWGLTRYESAAEAIGRRAMELPIANDLNRWAETLRDSNSRLSELLQQEGMIDVSLLDSSLIAHEQESFATASLECHLALQRYTDVISIAAPKSELFVERSLQRASLDEIRGSLAAIDAMLTRPSHGDSTHRREFRQQLDALVDQTRDHLSLIHGGMAKFSDDVRGEYRAWISLAWFCLVAAATLMAALVWMFHSHIVKPFRTLLVGSRLVAGGQFDHRIDLGTGDELCELAVAMNEMTDRFQQAYQQLNNACSDLDRQVRQRSREVIQNEQLASVGFLAAGVAHEINNPLATIAWSAESLESRIDEIKCCDPANRHVGEEILAALQTNLRRIQDEAFRCKGITEKLLDFSRMGEVKRAATDLAVLVREVVDMVSKVGKYRCKTIRLACDQAAVADVNPQEIRQVVLNLLTNALESVDSSGCVDVQVRSHQHQVTIRVTDNGCGMTTEVLQHLFEPFYTRRSDGSGTGLGLSISFRIVSQHGGKLIPHSDGAGLGSSMELILPVHYSVSDKPNRFNLNSTWKHESYQAA